MANDDVQFAMNVVQSRLIEFIYRQERKEEKPRAPRGKESSEEGRKLGRRVAEGAHPNCWTLGFSISLFPLVSILASLAVEYLNPRKPGR